MKIGYPLANWLVCRYAPFSEGPPEFDIGRIGIGYRYIVVSPAIRKPNDKFVWTQTYDFSCWPVLNAAIARIRTAVRESFPKQPSDPMDDFESFPSAVYFGYTMRKWPLDGFILHHFRFIPLFDYLDGVKWPSDDWLTRWFIIGSTTSCVLKEGCIRKWSVSWSYWKIWLFGYWNSSANFLQNLKPISPLNHFEIVCPELRENI